MIRSIELVGLSAARLLLVAAPLLVGCGVAFLPEPTKKPVKMSDLVGVWEYQSNHGESTITLDLRADGAFEQIVKANVGPGIQTHRGTWRVDGTSLDMRVLMPSNGYGKPWAPEEVRWYIVDEDQSFAIFGGTDADRDSFQSFKRVR